MDPGTGTRTLRQSAIRTDYSTGLADGPHEPHRWWLHARADALRLPFRDASFDYVFTSHLIEHTRDPRGALIEWLRVVRPGGHVASIIPNTAYTRQVNTDQESPHLHEWMPREFVQEVLGVDPPDWWASGYVLEWVPARVVSVDLACPTWSFHCVLEKLCVS